MKVKFSANAIKWFDKVNGNTYFSVRITNNKTGETITTPYEYGYEDQYKQSALARMYVRGWIPLRYGKKHKNGSDNLHMYERENDYPILWNVAWGLKRDCKANGEL